MMAWRLMLALIKEAKGNDPQGEENYLTLLTGLAMGEHSLENETHRCLRIPNHPRASNCHMKLLQSNL